MSRPRPATASTSSSPARTARSASSSWAIGVPHTAITASPMNFSTRPPCRSITWRRRVEVAGEEIPHVLGVPVLGQRGESHQVGEQHRHQTAFGRRCGRVSPSAATRASHRTRRRTCCRGRWRTSTTGRARTAACRTPCRTSAPPRSRCHMRNKRAPRRPPAKVTPPQFSLPMIGRGSAGRNQRAAEPYRLARARSASKGRSRGRTRAGEDAAGWRRPPRSACSRSRCR